MEHFWIVLTLIAAALQALRTAAQRDLNKHMSTLATTYVRSLFGLPVLIVYLAIVLAVTGEGAPEFTWPWLAYTFAGAMTQVAATVLLIMMFRLKSFGVGTMLTKFDIVFTAILGSLFFAETKSFGGIVALIVVMVGVVLMSLERTGLVGSGAPEAGLTTRRRFGLQGVMRTVVATLSDKAVQVALGCAFSFSLSYLTFREATHLIGEGSFVWRGAWTVLVAIAMQTVIIGAWIVWREPVVIGQLWPHRKLSSWIGGMSAVGSICWLTAFALQNASYVRAVGQVEVVFTLLVSAFYFKERITALEYCGIALTVIGVLLFRLIA